MELVFDLSHELFLLVDLCPMSPCDPVGLAHQLDGPRIPAHTLFLYAETWRNVSHSLYQEMLPKLMSPTMRQRGDVYFDAIMFRV
jgi:hypothetical protein